VSGDLATRIAERSSLAGVKVSPETIQKLHAYIELLARWNRRINLTALAVDPPTDEAIDRLLVEPLVAAGRIRLDDRLAVDVGSGGGSPAIPLKLAARHLRMVMVESRARKSAFLREAVRALGLPDIEVANCRLEELAARGELRGAVDLVTMRAVGPSDALWTEIRALLGPAGRVFWFGGFLTGTENPTGLRAREVVATPPASQLLILAAS
jgi:16S rRNA (guanine527-N7)-methyltransferase